MCTCGNNYTSLVNLSLTVVTISLMLGSFCCILFAVVEIRSSLATLPKYHEYSIMCATHSIGWASNSEWRHYRKGQPLGHLCVIMKRKSVKLYGPLGHWALTCHVKKTNQFYSPRLARLTTHAKHHKLGEFSDSGRVSTRRFTRIRRIN